MKQLKSLSIFIVILCPIIIIGYQNCSDLNYEHNLSEINTSENLAAPISFFSPSSLGYNTNNCTAEAILSASLFNPTLHLCVIAKDSCEKAFLESMSFTMDTDHICDHAVPEDAEELAEAFTEVKISDLGYTNSPEQICTMQYERLVNVKKRQCAHGANGCEISFLKQKGFSSDPASICQ